MVENITEDDMEIRLNEPAAEQYINNLQKLKEKYGLYGEVSLELIAGMPDVIKSIPSIEDEAEISEAIEKALRAALDMHGWCRFIGSRDQKHRWKVKNQEEKEYGSSFNETVVGSRRPFWTSDKKMEP